MSTSKLFPLLLLSYICFSITVFSQSLYFFFSVFCFVFCLFLSVPPHSCFDESEEEERMGGQHNFCMVRKIIEMRPKK